MGGKEGAKRKGERGKREWGDIISIGSSLDVKSCVHVLISYIESML